MFEVGSSRFVVVVLGMVMGIVGCERPDPATSLCRGNVWIARKITAQRALAGPGAGAPLAAAPLDCPTTEDLKDYAKYRFCLGDCAPFDWEIGELFPQEVLDRNPNLSKEDFSLEVREFCGIRWRSTPEMPHPPAESVQDLQDFANQFKIELQQDCILFGAQSDPEIEQFANEVSASAHDGFVRAAGGRAVDFDNVFLGPGGTILPRAHVTVLDTWPRMKHDGWRRGQGTENDPMHGRNLHGPSILRMLQDLRGEEQNSMDISTEVALPQRIENGIIVRDLENGGDFGYTSDLIERILAADGDWETLRQNNPNIPSHVMVAAIGSEPTADTDCANLATTSLPMLALQAALKQVACRGAVFVTSAGNSNGGCPAGTTDAVGCTICSTETGPTCPGRMANVDAPTEGKCEKLFGPNSSYSTAKYHFPPPPLPPPPPTPSPVPTSPYKAPLVYVASPVDTKGQWIASTRDGSRMPTAAVGSRAVSMLDGKWLDGTTGSSHATTVLGAALANVLTVQPTWSGPEAMDIVYASGLLLPVSNQIRNAEWFRSDLDDAPEIQRVSICSALELATERDDICPDYTKWFTPGRAKITPAMRMDNVTDGIPLEQTKEMSAGFTPPSTLQCLNYSYNLGTTPGMPMCKPSQCTYLVDTDDPTNRLAFIQLRDDLPFSLQTLTLVVYDAAGKRSAWSYEGSSSNVLPPGASFVMRTNSVSYSHAPNSSNTAFPNPGNLRSAWLEAQIEVDDHFATVTQEIPIIVGNID